MSWNIDKYFLVHIVSMGSSDFSVNVLVMYGRKWNGSNMHSDKKKLKG